MENKILFLNNNIIPSFFLTKKKKQVTKLYIIQIMEN